jgi:hypothetical protein
MKVSPQRFASGGKPIFQKGPVTWYQNQLESRLLGFGSSVIPASCRVALRSRRTSTTTSHFPAGSDGSLLLAQRN